MNAGSPTSGLRSYRMTMQGPGVGFSGSGACGVWVVVLFRPDQGARCGTSMNFVKPFL